jgi:hypothetical protein
MMATACSTVRAPVVPDPGSLRSIRTAYVVAPRGESRGTDAAIQLALAKRGIRASKGSEAQRPREVDAYVTFTELWRWDLFTQLKSLDISVFDSTTDALLASGQYRKSPFPLIPNVSDTAQEVVDSLFVSRQTARVDAQRMRKSITAGDGLER